MTNSRPVSCWKTWKCVEEAGTTPNRTSRPTSRVSDREVAQAALQITPGLGDLALRQAADVGLQLVQKTVGEPVLALEVGHHAELAQDRASHDGVLVLADISGFTAFVTATELEHGPQIIAALLEAVMNRLSPPLHIQEVEGDAVFAVGPDAAVAPPGRLLDVFEGALVAFKALQKELAADDSCTCGACRSRGRRPGTGTTKTSAKANALSSIPGGRQRPVAL